MQFPPERLIYETSVELESLVMKARGDVRGGAGRRRLDGLQPTPWNARKIAAREMLRR